MQLKFQNRFAKLGLPALAPEAIMFPKVGESNLIWELKWQ